MRKVITILLIAFIAIANNYVQAQPDCTATGGAWNSAATWGCGVVPTNPPYDSLIIPAGVAVDITFDAAVFTGTIQVYGSLTMFFGSLTLGPGSSIEIYTGGNVGALFETLVIDGVPVNLIGGYPGPQSITPAGPGQPLPIELLYFDANTVDDKVDLTWATAQEENFDYFSIERSSDGVNFKEIAQVNGSGNSTARLDYLYTDEFPLNGISYYRLTSVDFDGYSETFDAALVNVDNQTTDFAVYPNPVEGGELTLRTNFAPEQALDLVIYNNVGRIEDEYSITDWQNIIDVSGLQPGSYLLKLVTPDGVLIKRILVR